MVPDRAQGGASLAAGALELMLHRRTLLDDQRGVAEALNETECGCRDCACAGLIARGVHRVLLQARRSAWNFFWGVPGPCPAVPCVEGECVLLRRRPAAWHKHASHLAANAMTSLLHADLTLHVRRGVY